MSKQSPLPQSDEGFWAIINPQDGHDMAIGGYVTVVQIGPFDFLRIEYRAGAVMDRNGPAWVENANAPCTTLYPRNALPVIHLTSEAEVKRLGGPSSQKPI